MKLLDYIVKRMNGAQYGAPEFYWWVSENLPQEDASPILAAIDSGSEVNVKQAIIDHFEHHQLYPLALHYVAAAHWLDDDPEQVSRIEYSTYVTMHSTEHEVDTEDDEYEIECVYNADARLTLKRQVEAAFYQAIAHGHKPWRGLFIALPPNQFGAESVTFRCMKSDRDRVHAAFLEQQIKNRNLPLCEQQDAIIPDVHYNVYVNINRGFGETGINVGRVVTLHVKHLHVTAHPREWYKRF